MQTLDRKSQPKSYNIDKIKFENPTKLVLDNNVPIYYFNKSDQEILKIDFVFNAGTKYQEKPLISTLTNSLLKEGTKLYTSKQISEKIDFYGAYLQTSTSKDNAIISVYCLNKNLKYLLPIIAEVIKNPIFDKNELKLTAHKLKQRFILDSNKVNVIAAREFANKIFGKNHPYSYNVELNDFDNVKSEQLFSFYNRLYNVNNLKIIIAGNVNDEVIRSLSDNFSDKWNNNNITEYKKIQVKSVKKKFNLIKKEDAVQTSMRIGKILINRTSADYKPMLVVNTILGGYFGSRLMTNIREDKGYTYGIGSSVVSLADEGYFVISSEVGKDVCKKAIKEVYNEINKLKKELVSKEELNLVKNYMLGTILKSFDGVFSTSNNFISLMANNLDFKYYNELIETIKNINENEIIDLTNKYLETDKFIEVVAGNC